MEPDTSREGEASGNRRDSRIAKACLWLAALLLPAMLFVTLHGVARRTANGWEWIARVYASQSLAKDRTQDAGSVTHVVLTGRVLQTGVQRMGMNLGDQAFYNSAQMMKNLVSRNAGFEGLAWQSVLHCRVASTGQCTDAMAAAKWGDGFWQGASYEVISGAAEGHTGHITASRKADGTHGVELSLDGNVPLHSGDYIIARKQFPGNAQAGWWVEQGGGKVETEFKDLSPHTPGRQALRIVAASSGQSMGIEAFFDSSTDRSFLRMNGRFRLSFRAKLLAGKPVLHLSLLRQTKPTETPMYSHDADLTSTWRDYSFEFTSHEPDSSVGPVRLRFGVEGTSLLLDDVSLERVDGDPTNNTAFRDDVVNTLTAYRPGVLRYMASVAGLGSSVANLEADQFARQRSDYSAWQDDQASTTYGLKDFLELCAKVHADPWIVLPTASSAAEATQLVEWLHQGGWTQKFSHIHIEFGNEAWNSIFYGETIEDPAAYAHRASVLFMAMRHAKGFDSARYDLIAGGFFSSPERNADEVKKLIGADSLDVAPYLMHNVNNESSQQAMFGPLLAQPQQISTAGGLMVRNRKVTDAAPYPLHLEVYEVNLHTTEGSISQKALDQLTPSLGAGLAVAEHMLLMLRDDGVTTQALFNLPGTYFPRNDGKVVQLWGTTVDMGNTNRRRPQFLAMQMVNAVLHEQLLETHLSGYDPVWTEASANDGVSINNAHEVESFAFAGANGHSLVLMNLSLTEAHSVALDGVAAPHGRVRTATLNAASIEANNETANNVAIQAGSLDLSAGNRITLPPHSMMTISW